jgi:hypothetical protein
LYHQPLVEDSSLFLSEKTFKCLAMMHPFVLFGRPGLLKGLKQIGFKTFSPYINESYDDIEDDIERFNAIFSEIQRLINLSDDEWLTIQSNLKETLEYNQKHFFNSTQYGVSTDIERLFNQPKSTDVILMPLTSDVDWTLQNTTLDSGIQLQYPTHLDGGRLQLKDELNAQGLNSPLGFNSNVVGSPL